MPLRQTPKGLFLHVRATPKAGRNELTGVVVNAAGQRSLGVKVTAVADKGAANKAVIETLAKIIGVSKSSFELVSGETARDKTLRICKNEAVVTTYMKGVSP